MVWFLYDKKLRHERVNNKCSNILAFLISQMKLIKRTEKLGLDLFIKLQSSFIKNIYQQRGKKKEDGGEGQGWVWSHLSNFMLKKAEQKSFNPILLSSRLKKSPYKGGTKIAHPSLLNRPASIINSSLDFSVSISSFGHFAIT